MNPTAVIREGITTNRLLTNRGEGFRPMYEKVFHHYQNRAGIETPFTEQAVTKLRKDSHQRNRRPRSVSAADTLMFAGQRDRRVNSPLDATPQAKLPRP